jgi:AraC-like DNA-binding protein/quercetin dioxygenase-like cupin family protein
MAMATQTPPLSRGARVRGRGFRVQRIDYSPEYRRGMHSHDTTGITLVLHGDFRETACGQEETASALSVVVKPAGTVHADEVGPRGARTVAVEIPDEAALLEEPVDLGRWRWLHAGPGVRPLLALGRALLDPAAGPDPEEAVLELLGEVVDAPGPPEGTVPAWIRRAREAIDDMATQRLRVQTLAESLGVHPVSLTRAFRRAYGVPVTTYRRRVRLHRAAGRVAGSDRDLCTIALDAGYADQAHMCRELRAATGLSPSLLRRVARA